MKIKYQLKQTVIEAGERVTYHVALTEDGHMLRRKGEGAWTNRGKLEKSDKFDAGALWLVLARSMGYRPEPPESGGAKG